MSGIHGLDVFLEKIERAAPGSETEKIVAAELQKIEKNIRKDRLAQYDRKKAVLKLAVIKSYTPALTTAFLGEKKANANILLDIVSQLLVGDAPEVEIGCLAVGRLLKREHRKMTFSLLKKILEKQELGKTPPVLRLLQSILPLEENSPGV
ncbi:MAG: uncharacterized protein A8A55_2278, partial [Amphiamblys sp. WSBS2006]